MEERLISANFVGWLLNYEQHCIINYLVKKCYAIDNIISIKINAVYFRSERIFDIAAFQIHIDQKFFLQNLCFNSRYFKSYGKQFRRTTVKFCRVVQ